MIRQNTPQASLRAARKAPFTTRGLGGKPATHEQATKTPHGQNDITLTPEQEHICDRATD